MKKMNLEIQNNKEDDRRMQVLDRARDLEAEYENKPRLDALRELCLRVAEVEVPEE